MTAENRSFFLRSWPVLFADNHLLALYKPAGLLIQGDRTGDMTLIDLARQWVKVEYRKPGRVYLGMVHRIDRPVIVAYIMVVVVVFVVINLVVDLLYSVLDPRVRLVEAKA